MKHRIFVGDLFFSLPFKKGCTAPPVAEFIHSRPWGIAAERIRPRKSRLWRRSYFHTLSAALRSIRWRGSVGFIRARTARFPILWPLSSARHVSLLLEANHVSEMKIQRIPKPSAVGGNKSLYSCFAKAAAYAATAISCSTVPPDTPSPPMQRPSTMMGSPPPNKQNFPGCVSCNP